MTRETWISLVVSIILALALAACSAPMRQGATNPSVAPVLHESDQPQPRGDKTLESSQEEPLSGLRESPEEEWERCQWEISHIGFCYPVDFWDITV